MSSRAGGEREDGARVRAERLGGGEREHGADALAAGQQAVAHGLLEALGGGLLGEAQVGQVGLDLLPELLRVDGAGGGCAHDSSASWPAAPAALIRRADPAVQLGPRLGGDAGAVVHERGGAVGVELPGAQLGGEVLEALDQRVEAVGLSHVGAILAHGVECCPEDAVDEAGRVGAAERLGGLDGLVDGALGGDRVVGFDEVGVQHLEQRGAEDGLLERRDAIERPALGVALDAGVELFGVVGGRVRERAREDRGVALEDVVERPAREVVLVEGEDRGPPLIAPTHGTCSCLTACRP